jgi:hypothetical protein
MIYDSGINNAEKVSTSITHYNTDILFTTSCLRIVRNVIDSTDIMQQMNTTIRYVIDNNIESESVKKAIYNVSELRMKKTKVIVPVIKYEFETKKIVSGKIN